MATPSEAATVADGPAPGGMPAGTVTRRRLHPLSPLLDLVVIGWRMLPVLFVAVVNDLRAAVLVPVIAAVLGWRYVAWRRTWWQVDGGVLRIESGVLQRSLRVIPADRVQQVEVVRKLRHLAVGAAAVRVQLAGGDQSTAVLDVLSVADAELLQRTLDTHRRGQAVIAPGQELPPPAPPARTVLQLGPGLLALGGMTGFGLVLVPLAIGALFDTLTDIGVVPDPPEDGSGLGSVSGWAVVVLAVAAVVVWIAVGAATGIVRHHGYTLEQRPPDELVIRRGLLERRTDVVPVRRIQRIDVLANPLRRMVRLARVEVGTAAQQRSDDDGGNDLRPGVPVLRRRDLPLVLDTFLPGAGAAPALRAHPTAARRRAVVRRCVLLLPPALLLGFAATDGRPGPAPAVAAVVAVALAAVWGHVWYTNLGHAVDGRFLHVRTGAFAPSRTIVVLGKVQSVRVTSSPFQRRAGLVSVHADLVRGAVVVRDVAAADGSTLTAVLRTHAGG